MNFREVFARYAALSESGNAETPNDILGEFFGLGSAENKNIASNCIARRNREKLTFKQTMARNEFVDMISELTVENSGVLVLAIQLAACVNDEDAVADLNALTFRPVHPTNGPSNPTSHPAHV